MCNANQIRKGKGSVVSKRLCIQRYIGGHNPEEFATVIDQGQRSHTGSTAENAIALATR